MCFSDRLKIIKVLKVLIKFKTLLALHRWRCKLTNFTCSMAGFDNSLFLKKNQLIVLLALVNWRRTIIYHVCGFNDDSIYLIQGSLTEVEGSVQLTSLY